MAGFFDWEPPHYGRKFPFVVAGSAKEHEIALYLSNCVPADPNGRDMAIVYKHHHRGLIVGGRMIEPEPRFLSRWSLGGGMYSLQEFKALYERVLTLDKDQDLKVGGNVMEVFGIALLLTPGPIPPAKLEELVICLESLGNSELRRKFFEGLAKVNGAPMTLQKLINMIRPI